jgi:hypothetical protein
MTPEPYRVLHQVWEDHVWVGLIRTYAPNQFQEVMNFLIGAARKSGLKEIRGQVNGPARERLFRMKGWTTWAAIQDRPLYLRIMSYTIPERS